VTVQPPQESRSPEEEDQAADDDVPVELRLDLPSFEGPMDLLLELVRDREIEIFEIPISEITDHYLACIDRMEELNLEVGGDWLQMAARLMHIKSRTLLPDDDEEDDEEGPDPREELVRRLVAYERFKHLAEKLDDRPRLGSGTFTGPANLEEYRRDSGPPEVRDADVSDLIGAVRNLLEDSEDEEDFVYEMSREKLNIRTIALDIADRLDDSPRLTFDSLFGDGPPSRNRVVTTFVALLEMTRLGLIHLFQARLGAVDKLYVERAVIDIVEVSQSLDLGDDHDPEDEPGPADDHGPTDEPGPAT
jgi:segregation and condensation protein A